MVLDSRSIQNLFSSGLGEGKKLVLFGSLFPGTSKYKSG